jgi:DNA helicase-2/ATP-dependent DNA helicase PcrA
MPNVQDLLDHLNDRQREAVIHGDGPLLVLAGAGSGKTRVLTHRVAHLVHAHGLDPRSILAFTFTNKAAREMKGRIVALIGDVPGLWVGTFHAICLRILRAHPDLVERTASFAIYDADDQIALVKACLKAFDLSDREYRPPAVHGQISRAKNNLVDHAAFEAAAASAFDRTAARIYREYDRRLKAANAFDFDDLILRTIGLLRREPAVLGRYTERFEHVLVDEYQDTNHAQYILISLLASGRRNLAVVGDDDQSIYGWRGADIRNILSFEEAYPDATVIRLEQNYRSTKTILRAANQVVAHNTGRKPKELWTENETGEPIRLWMFPDEEREADAIVGEIQALVRRGETTYGGMVVLYRTHAQSRPLEAALRRTGIAYDLVGGISFYERREVKDILAYLRVLDNPGDDVSLARIVNVPKRGIGPTSLERVGCFARSAVIGLRAACARLGEIPELGTAQVKHLAEFSRLLARLDEGRDLPAADRIVAVIEAVGYLAHLAEDDPESAGARRENLDELVAAAAHYAEVTGDPSVAGFLAEVALVAAVDRMSEEGERVTLMTAHNAKGLEFPLVFVAGLEQGLFPHASSFDDPRQLEEERRLFYVALTRAERRVTLSAARERRRMGGYMSAEVSDFVHELPADVLEASDFSGYGRDFAPGRGPRAAAGRASGGLHASSGPRPSGGHAGSGPRPSGGRDDGPGMPRRYRPEELPRAPLARARTVTPAGATERRVVEPDSEEGWTRIVGARVVHAQFGSGVVVGQEGHGPDARLTVRFAGGLTKRVLARFLSLVGL